MFEDHLGHDNRSLSIKDLNRKSASQLLDSQKMCTAEKGIARVSHRLGRVIRRELDFLCTPDYFTRDLLGDFPLAI
jgi:hypothetical protein